MVASSLYDGRLRSADQRTGFPAGGVDEMTDRPNADDPEDAQGDVHRHVVDRDTPDGRGVARREGFGDAVDDGPDESDLARGDSGRSARGDREGPG
jgi:hypothetical protein